MPDIKIPLSSLKRYKKYLIGILVFVGVCLYIFISNEKDRSSLIRNLGFTKAVITDFDIEKVGKYTRNPIIKYGYKVDGKYWEGKGERYNIYHLNDTIIIIYDTIQVKNSMPYLDFYEKELLPPIPDSLEKWTLYRTFENDFESFKLLQKKSKTNE